VINEQQQYSIWPAERTPPAGWRTVGEPAGRAECLRRIGEAWTDARPAALRAQAGEPGA
jgi:MbtH protein